MAVSLRGGRFVSARNASSCSPAGVAASAVTVHLRRKNRSRRKSHGTSARRIGGATTATASKHGQPTGRGIQVVDGGRDFGGCLAGRVKRLADGIADYRNVLCSMARRRQVACDTVRAALDLPSGLGNRRDRVVNGGCHNYPYRRPHGDGGIAEQLGQQSAGRGGVGQVPGCHNPDPSTGRPLRCPIGWPDASCTVRLPACGQRQGP